MRPLIKYRTIKKFSSKYSVTQMCRFFGVSRSGYYDYLKRGEQPERNTEIAEMIRDRRNQRYGRSLGCRRMQKWLLEQKRSGLRHKYLCLDIIRPHFVPCKTHRLSLLRLVTASVFVSLFTSCVKHYHLRKLTLDERLYQMYDKIQETDSALIECRDRK